MKKSNYFLAILAVLFSFTACNDFPEPPYPQPPYPSSATIIFSETFGVPAGNTLIANYTGFVTTGIGSENVRFSSSGGTVDVRDSQNSIGYPGASGGGNVLFSATVGGNLYIRDIETRGARNLVLSFGTNQTHDILSVYYQPADSVNWTAMTFHKGNNFWGLVRFQDIILPEGTEAFNLRFSAEPVQFGARIDDVRIFTKDETTATLLVSPASISFIADGGSHRLNVSSNVDWTAVSSDPENFAVAISNNIITVTATRNACDENPRTAEITVTSTDGSIVRVVEITQDFQAGTLIFNETFGNPTANTPIADYTGWETTGIGAGAVYFVGTTTGAGGLVDVRSTASSAGHYPGASGGGNVLFSAGSGGRLYVNNIAVCGAQNLRLSFGTNQSDDIISVAYSIDGDGVWITIPFVKATDSWGLVDNLRFSLPAGTDNISLRFSAEPVGFGARIDDITITTIDTTSGC